MRDPSSLWLEKNYTNPNDMEIIYKNTPLEHIPWNNETPPNALVELVVTGKVRPCKAIDLGCGAGNYTIYLAENGFDVTGIDISSTAIEKAKEKAEKKGLQCRFWVGDVLDYLDTLKETFEFAYDWQVLHHIFPEKRRKYVESVYRILSSEGKYLSVCFNEQNSQFGGTGKYRKTPLGTTLYFSSEGELQRLFEPYFNIIDLKTIEITAKSTNHLVNYAFMEKKSCCHILFL